MTTLRIAFFGTPEIAVPTLERLMDGPHTVTIVVSQPDRPRGRGRKTSPSPVAQVAEKAGIPLLRPERVGDPDCIAALEAHTPDLGPASTRIVPSKSTMQLFPTIIPGTQASSSAYP